MTYLETAIAVIASGSLFHIFPMLYARSVNFWTSTVLYIFFIQNSQLFEETLKIPIDSEWMILVYINKVTKVKRKQKGIILKVIICKKEATIFWISTVSFT